MNTWEKALSENPLIAILRGLDPDQAINVADVLVNSGFRIIEVPLNSDEPLVSIRRIADKYGDQIIVGAGTVLTAQDVSAVVEAGGQIIVSPNMDPVVGQRAVELGVKWCPGVVTPTEAFKALQSGAAMLKLFPAELVSPSVIKAIRAVLPKGCLLAAVGGITPQTMVEYHNAGTDSFGLGSALFKPEYSLDELQDRALAFVSAYKELTNR